MVESASNVMALLSHDGNVLYLNGTGRRLLGIDEVEPRAVLLSDLMFGKSEREILSRVSEIGEWCGDGALRHQRTGAAVPVEAAFVALASEGDDSELLIALEARPGQEGNGNGERRHSSHEIQAARMDSVARVVSGLSRHFEDLLAAVSGFSEVVVDRFEDEDGLRDRAERALKACQSTAGAIQQLLSVRRGESIEPAVTSSNDKVRETLKLLGAILGEGIVVQTELSPDPALVRADPAQLEEVLIHLIVNARDAMPDGGTITIRTATVKRDELPPSLPGAPGSYVRISVADTGRGMDKETLSLAFEPFFSSKERGAGLGLASVYGIVSRSGGHITADSRPGAGATFAVYLPAADNPRQSRLHQREYPSP
jgi:signal transduction histidine kinase